MTSESTSAAASESANFDADQTTDNVIIGMDQTPAAAAPIATSETNPVVNIADEDVPLAVLEDEDDTADVVNIEDEETPLAANVNANEGASAARRFWWWVLAVVGSITGKVSYDKENKKNLFAERETEKKEDEE